MATPSKKNPEIDSMIKNVFGFDRAQSVKNDTCVFCKTPAVDFRDELSRKEFTISGMCQDCQDKVF